MTDEQINAYLRAAKVQLATNPQAALENHSNLQTLSDYMQKRGQLGEVAGPPPKFTPTGRAIPRDDEYERMQSLVTNQPTEAGTHQWAVVKPNGQVHGAPFDFKGSALRIADTLNKAAPGHTVQALSVDSPEIARYVPRPDLNANPFKKATAEEIDAMLLQGDKPQMAEGGEVEFDPIESARERAYGSSSPGSPGISGAIKDAINALRSYLLTPAQNQVAEDKRRAIDSQVEDHADGGTVEGPSTEHEQKAGLGKRFGMRVAEQAYGLDANGQPVLGGRAWTKTQGGTPMGILDEITSVPHNLLSLAHTTRSLDPLRKYFPDSQGLEDKLFESIDPQWSKDASDRLERLRAAMNSRFGIGEAHSIPEHMTDAAASLVSPIPMAKEGEQANLARRVLEMTTPLRPRTVKNFATDTAVLGGLGTGIDALTDRLSHLRAQTGSPGGGAPVDPANFSRDMGLSEDRPVSNSHHMIPMVTEHGDIYYGVDPNTLADGGSVSRRGSL
jgi:hypothetical protein